jgi:catechol 2,3-dioxygenase-like lactoylglutathione lyase family enzyme
MNIRATNTILYCKKWRECVVFYRDKLLLPVNFENDWFVEFYLRDGSYLSIANEERATIKSSKGNGITITLCVNDCHESWEQLTASGIMPEDVNNNPWGGKSFFFYDPEGNRLEIWSARDESIV